MNFCCGGHTVNSMRIHDTSVHVIIPHELVNMNVIVVWIYIHNTATNQCVNMSCTARHDSRLHANHRRASSGTCVAHARVARLFACHIHTLQYMMNTLRATSIWYGVTAGSAACSWRCWSHSSA